MPRKVHSRPAKVYNCLNNKFNVILRYCQKWEECLNTEITKDQFENILTMFIWLPAMLSCVVSNIDYWHGHLLWTNS